MCLLLAHAVLSSFLSYLPPHLSRSYSNMIDSFDQQLAPSSMMTSELNFVRFSTTEWAVLVIGWTVTLARIRKHERLG
ncbi:uncharacterized protein BO95DRAFT_438603 [Aspergillus brunneoviolaceus CBS 621.78]|uniref:Uncharacterized protein n=1 Tax=Aspergillus brunneoviolaceus CBS 621.78 TaxID=1450534 RepID=A0ACD1GLN2_9EURO|nr:hypothetical protein BO95DRAFT_438603 [Aspergillus brunneoviolaceus CBS 621.78]RAH50249.1 hypothetical protein BO95DRAFT_438603 [Aspergillus brunneoviolaceus CBS 621.78]